MNLTAVLLALLNLVTAEVYQSNGIKIGEVDQNSATIWMRLTENAAANDSEIGFLRRPKTDRKNSQPPTMAEQLPKGKTLADMHGAVPGASGRVRLSVTDNDGNRTTTDWNSVDPAKDFTWQHQIANLQPGHEYSVSVESQNLNGEPGQTIHGKFRTAPAADQESRVSFVVVTGQEYSRKDSAAGHKIYPAMQKLNPDFFIHTGDIEYYDKPDPFATNQQLARFKWNRLYGLPNLSKFHSQVGSYFMKDDHDTTKNDSWPGQNYGQLTWQQGLDLFREQFPIRKDNFRTIRWGKDLQIWLVEGRDYRSPNNMPDGPDKTIWGTEQKKWFVRTVEASDATFRVLISPTPVVGPDRSNKNDNHANEGFQHEGDEIRQFIAKQKNMFVVCGDRHWQYVSVDGKTGVKEFSCGPTSDQHAGGWKQNAKLPEHTYLNVQGGFLNIIVDRHEGRPTLAARHYDVQGKVSNQDLNKASD